MTRGQYIAMCAIGALALVAYLQAVRTGQALAALNSPVGAAKLIGLPI